MSNFPVPTVNPVTWHLPSQVMAALNEAFTPRAAIAGLLVQTTTGTARPGLLSGSATLVTGRADRTVNVGRFTAALVRPSDGGATLIGVPKTVQVSMPAPPPWGSRYDVLWVREPSLNQMGADWDSNPVFGVTSGETAAQPTLPPVLAAVPEGALPLASVLIASTADSTNAMTIGQLVSYTSLAGAPFWFRDVSELTSAFAASLAVGTRARKIDSLVEWEVRSTGGTNRWVRLGGGTYHGTANGSASSGSPTPFLGFTRVAADSDRDDFVSFSNGVFTIGEGDINGTASVALASRPTTGSRTYVELQDADTGVMLFRGSTWVEDYVNVPFTFHPGSGGRRVRLVGYQSNQASQVLTAHVYASKTA